jgi:hypothetical protein
VVPGNLKRRQIDLSDFQTVGMTNSCRALSAVLVEATARSAYDYGYNVVTVVNSRTDRDADAHRHSVERIFPRVSETDTANRMLKLVKEPSW